MIRKVYKYKVTADDYFDVNMPKDAEILTVQEQFPDEIYMWALVDTSKPIMTRHFRLAGTGHPIKEESLTYIGTFQLMNHSLVFHLFEV